ncbi:MAG: hypothetical protein ACP5QR_16150, partial [Rhizomicrobium sp.]
KWVIERKKETCRTRNRRARKSRKRIDHQKDADFNPHQQRAGTFEDQDGLKPDQKRAFEQTQSGRFRPISE